MRCRYFGGTDNAERRAKIDEAKGRLPMLECGEGNEIDVFAVKVPAQRTALHRTAFFAPRGSRRPTIANSGKAILTAVEGN